MSITVLDLSVEQFIPVQLTTPWSTWRRSDEYKLTKRIHPDYTDYYMAQWDLLNTVAGKNRLNKYLSK